MGHWYPFAILCVLVNVIFLLMQPFLDESPRWLITKNRYEEAASIINKIRNLSQSFSMKLSWNNGNRDPRWGVAEIQKMSPPTTVGDAAAVLSNKGVPQFWEM